MTKPRPLPIDNYLPDIIDEIKKSPSILLKAEPGAGKTTRLPPALMELGNVIVLEPRRLAAKLSAEHVAESAGEACGESVGYQVRFDHKVGEKTKLRYMTEGLFIRRLENDPNLEGIDFVVLDEFHERHLDTDLSLAFIRHLQESTRPDLKLIIMSATVDLTSLENYLPETKTFEVPGKVFPVETSYKPYPNIKKVEDKVSAAVLEMIKESRSSGHILVFLTGYQQIKTCQSLLTNKLDHNQFEVHGLSAELPPQKQRVVFAPSKKRKIILSTNVAETSVTIPGITGVIDTGLAKVSSFAPWSGLPVLQVKKISRASCIQRAGRAGRTQEGLCYRLFDINDFNKRDAFTPDEIVRSDLSQLILFIKSRLKIESNILDALHWLTPPPEKHLDSCDESLIRLGALNKKGAITEKGQFLASLPLHPRLGSIVYEAKKEGLLAYGLIAVALISEEMILDRNSRAFEDSPCDISFQANVLLQHLKKQEFDSIRLERAINPRQVTKVLKLYNQIRKITNGPAIEKAKKFDPKLMGPIILAGFPDRVAKYRPAAKNKRNPGERSFHFCLGRGGILSDYSTVRKKDFLVVLSATETPGFKNSAIKTQIRFASAVSIETLKKYSSMLRKEFDLIINEKTGAIQTSESTFYGQVQLEEKISEAQPDQIQELLNKTVLENWPYPFDNCEPLDIYHKKLDLIETSKIEHNFPRFDGEFLELLVEEICEGKKSLEDIKKVSLGDLIHKQLSYEEQVLLDSLTPATIKVNGRSKKVSYLGEQSPSVSGRIQEFFGCADPLSICEGKLALNIILLAPNHRPAQITNNLHGFWTGSYGDVRKELARRYPKHHWPENPLDESQNKKK